jgi:baseplate J-like protein
VSVFRCQNERRRAAVTEHATLNGIDFLEVLDHEAPAGIDPQRTLVIRLLKPIDAISASNVALSGGERLAVGVVWAARAVDTMPDATPADMAFMASFGTEGDRVLIVRTDSFGDYSTYRLRIVTSPVDATPPPNVDPALSSVLFSFKVECPSPFDCVDDPRCPVHGASGTPIDYLVKDYDGFRRLMLDRMTASLPEWRDRNPADIGVALIELLASVADEISYAQDAVGTEAHLPTARERVSVRRHARLLDYLVGEGCNARAWIAVEVAPTGDGEILPVGTPILSRAADWTASTIVDPNDLDDLIAKERPTVFELVSPVVLQSAHNRIEMHTWSDAECCLPAGSTSATLRRAPGFALKAGDVVILEEEIGVDTGLPADADPSRRHAVVLTRVTTNIAANPMADPLDGTPIAEIEWSADDALPFPLRVSASVPADAGGRVVRPVTVVRGNVTLADHGLTVKADEPIPAEAPMAGRYRPQLARIGLTYASEVVASSASAALRVDPARARPVVELEDETGTRWQPVPDLISSDRFAANFAVEPSSDGSARLRFGDGASGRMPSGGTQFTATYRVGSGSQGNVGPEALGRVATSLGSIQLVRNPIAASGGTDPEPTAMVKLVAPSAFRTPERAVNTADYAEVTQRHAGVQKAAARMRWTGSWYTAFVAVDRAGGEPVDRAAKVEFERHLDRYRMAGRDVHVDGGRPVSLDIVLTVCPRSGVVAADLMRALVLRLGAAEIGDGTRGFFHPDNFTFGQSLYLSQIYEAVMREPGIAWMDAKRFQRWGRAPAGEIEAGVLKVGALEIVRCNNDRSFPERGRLEVIMAGGR